MAGPRKLSLLIQSGDYGRLHYGLVTASAAAAIGRPVCLFFTMQACLALVVGKSADRPGWHDLHAEGGEKAAAIDGGYRARGIAGFAELLEACRDLGVRFMVCETGLLSIGAVAADLRPDLDIEVGGVVAFLHQAEDSGDLLFI